MDRIVNNFAKYAGFCCADFRKTGGTFRPWTTEYLSSPKKGENRISCFLPAFLFCLFLVVQVFHILLEYIYTALDFGEHGVIAEIFAQHLYLRHIGVDSG